MTSLSQSSLGTYNVATLHRDEIPKQKGTQQADRHNRINLRLVKGKNTWEGLAFQQLQARATAGRNVAHLVGKPSLLNSSNGVTSTNDGRDTLPSELSQLLRDCLRQRQL